MSAKFYKHLEKTKIMLGRFPLPLMGRLRATF